jgi:hypothetical protein
MWFLFGEKNRTYPVLPRSPGAFPSGSAPPPAS